MPAEDQDASEPNIVPTALSPCPASPNCVCSTDDGTHYIEPLRFDGPPDQAWQALLQLLSTDKNINIVSSNDRHIRAEATTRMFRFTDDIEFLLDRKDGVIHLRSASRVGYYDLGKNRRRLEQLRRAFARDRGAAVTR